MNKLPTTPTHLTSLRQVLREYLLVLLGPLLLFGPALLRGQVMFWGTPSLQFVSWWVQVWNSLRQGSLPLWNPLNGMGAPLIANYQLAFFYPPNWLLLPAAAAGGAAGVAWVYTFLAMLHLAWAGLGMAFLLRQLRFPWLAQIIGGLAFGLSGYIVARLGFLSMAWAAAWLPWVIYFADAIASPAGLASERPQARGRWLVPGLVVCMALMLLAGHAQLSWYTLLLAGAWVTLGALRQPAGPGLGWVRQVGQAWLRFAGAGLLAATIAAVQLVPTFLYLRQSARADAYSYEEALVYSFWPWRLISLASPDFFGNPASADFWGYASYWEDHLYLGVTPLLLALASLFLLIRAAWRGLRVKLARQPAVELAGHSPGRPYPRRGPLLLALWLLLIPTFVLAMGRYTPVFPFLYQHVPTFAMFQAPARYLIWAAFALPMLAAFSIERWRSPSGRGLYWFRLGTAGAFAITLGAGLAWLLVENVRLTFIRSAAITGLWALGFGLLTLAIPLAQKHGRTRLWMGAVILWTLADLLLVSWRLVPTTTLDFYQGAAPNVTEARQAAGEHRIYLDRDQEYDLKLRRFFRFRSYQPLEDWRELRATYVPNLNLLDGLPSANNFDPLTPGRFTRWMNLIDTLGPRQRPGWLALMGVGAIEQIDISRPHGVRFDSVANAARWRWFACVQTFATDDLAWEAVMERAVASVDPLTGPLILEGQPSQAGDCQIAANPATIQLLAERPGELLLQVEADQTGWLMIADSYDPAWQATRDGAATPIYPAYGQFLGIEVPPGLHQVSIKYRPIGFYFGALSSILGLLCLTLIYKQRGRSV